MLLTIHDANLKKVAFIDNDKQETLNYYDDIWARSLETGSSTFEFTVYKKAIKSDTAINKTYNLLNERAFVSFRYHGKSYVFNVMTVEENEQTITCYCENLNLELINEYANPYKATKAMSFVEYCNAMELLNFTHLSVGINEISDQKRTLEWEGRDTKLARLLSLAKKFDAEIDFDTQLNADSSIKSFKVNVYHENDDKHQGVGRVRNDIQLTYGKNLKSITRKIDKTGIYTMVRPYGKKTNGENETIISIGNLSAWSENNADGVREFYQSGDGLYAPLAAQMYPSTFTSGTQADQWIRKDLEVDSDNPTVIRAAGIANLKKNAYPAITYDVDGFIDVDVGDTVKIYDDGFSPILLVKARVSDQKISFTNPNSNKTTFANFKALENNLSDGIQAAFERLFEASKPYLIKLSTDNGVIFKNQIGQSIITPSLYKGGKPVTTGVTWRWSLDGNVITGMTYTVRGADVTDTATLTVAAYIGNDEVAVDEISFVNVLDGTMGTPGTPGKDGRTPYVHTAWANNATGTSGFSLDNSTNKLYIGIYTDFEPADSTDPTKYNWTLIKGEKGDKGADGLPGKDGVGIQSTVITYGLSASDSTQPSTWTTTVPNLVKGQYLWTKTVWTYSDNTSETGYVKTYIAKDGNNGNDGIAGKDGVGIRSTTITYASSSSGTTAPTSGWSTSVPTVSQGMFLWTKTVWTYSDNTNETGYSVAKMGETGAKGEKGDPGNDGLPGAPGVGIQSTVSTYGLSSNETTQPATWSATVPALIKGQYLWTKNVWTYTDGKTETGYTKTYIPQDGNNGTNGIAGKDGVGIKSTTITYAASSSGTTAPSTGWSTSVPTVSQGMFLWTKTVWTYTDNTSETGYSVARMGTDGAQGTPGPKGADGKTSYHHWAYSDNADGTGLTLTDNGQRYMGYYTDYTQADSMDKTKYTWADRWAKIEVDGRNLAQKTSSAWSTPYTSFYGTTNNCPSLYKVLIDDLAVGDTLKSRIILKYTNVIPASGQIAKIWLQGDGNVTSWNAGRYTESTDTPISGSGEMVFEHEFKITADHLKNQFWNLRFRTDYIASGSLQWKLAKVEKGTVFTGWSPAHEDTKEELAKVVYKTDISVTDEGIVHSATKTVNGQTIASMIAQRAEWVEIIANLLKVKGDMIVDGTIGANKLSVSTLSALTADLGKISGGSLELLESMAQATSVDAWGNFTIPAHKWGLYIDNIGAISSGTPVRKSSSESTASDMPVAVLTSGQLRFARVNQNNDLGSVLHYGLSDPDNATISFAVASDGTKQLLIQANGQIVNQGTNYTGWNSTGVSGVYYKRQGDVVALKMNVTTTANQTYSLGKIPVALLPIPSVGTMMRVTAWTADQSFGRNLQINGDGSMALLASSRGDAFNTQVTWII